MHRDSDDLKSLLEADDAKTKIKAALESGLQSLYHCFYLYYKDFHTRSRFDIMRSRFLIWIVGVLVYSLQLLSLTYPPDITDWTSFRWWVYFASVPRVDFLLVIFHLGAVGFYVTIGVVMSPVVLFGCFLLGRRRKGDGRVYYLISLSSRVLKTFLHLSGLCMLLAVQKYSAAPALTAPEYLDADATGLNIPVVGQVSCIFIAILTIWVLVETSLDYDMIYSRMQAVVTARAHSKIECLALLGVTCVAISHFFLQPSNASLHLALSTCCGFGLLFLYLFYLPYYNLFTNFVYGMCYFILGWGGLVQLLGIALNSCTTTFILTISIPPVACYIYWDLLERRTRQIKDTFIGKFVRLSNPYLAELAVRFVAMEYLEQKQAKKGNAKLKETLRDLYLRMTGKFDTSKFAAMCEFLYVYNILNHEGLARLKLSKARNCPFDFESDYNEYRFSMLLENYSKQNYEEVHYVRFRDLYDTAKKADEDACILQLDFWTELSMEVPVVKTIETMSIRLFGAINRARKLSKKLLKKFPQNHLALKLFGTFLLEVYNDTEKGQELLSRGIYEEKQLGNKPQGALERFSYFDDNNGIMLVSGNLETVGMISYINSQACQLLGVPARIALAMNISNFLPSYAVDLRKHNRAMLRFMATCSSYEVNLPVSLFLVDNSSFLIEVFLQARCMVLDQDPFFIVVLKAASFTREVALFDEDEVIQSHTRGFPVLVGFSDDISSMKGCSLRQAFTGFEELRAAHGLADPFVYRLPNTVNELILRFLDVQISNTVIHCLHVTASAEEAASWKDGESGNFEEMMHMLGPTLPVLDSQEAEFNKPTKHGILRDSRMPKKKVHITFNLNPEVREIDETDFSAGKQIIGKVKDAAPLKKEAEKAAAEAPKDDAKSKVSFNEGPSDAPILDLKDLQDFGNTRNPNSDQPADQMSRISELIAPSEVSDNRRNGTSVASSAVSANASFTSSAKAQELLNSVNSAMRRFKVSFILTHIVVMAAVLAMMLYLYFITHRYLSIINITDLSNQSIVMTDLALEARLLEMIATGKSSSSLESTVVANLEQDATYLADIRSRLSSQVSDWEDGPQKDLYLKAKIITWQLENGVITSSFQSLLNYMDMYVLNAHALALTPTFDRNATSPNFFFLYRNAFSMGTRLANESLTWFIDSESTNLSSVMDIILVLGGVAAVLLAVFLFAVICPTVVAVERSNQNVWSFFYGLPLDIVQEMSFRCEERLESTHGLELDRQNNERRKFKNMDTRERIKCSRKWPVIVTRMWLYYALTFGFFLFFYYEGYSTFSTILRMKPVVENLAGQRVLEADNGYFWLQESLLYNDSSSYFSLLPNSQLITSLPDTAIKYVDHLKYFDYQMIQGDYQGFGMTANDTGLIFDNGCTSTSVDCSDSLLVRGLHSGINAYIQDVDYEVDALASIHPSATLTLTKQLIHNLGESLLNDYITQITNQLNQLLQLIIGITVLYMVLSGLFYFVLYVPMANYVRRQITETWELARLIPIDLLERILKALKKTSVAKKK